MNPKADFYFDKAGQWEKATTHLRSIVLDCGLTEEVKWGSPCYTHHNSNIVLIHVFKEYCAILFFKGALLHDPESILVQQSENTQATRQIRFTSAKEVTAMQATIKAYIYEAIEVEKAGLTVKLKKVSEFHMPEEFQTKLDKMPKLKKAFEALTPGRQRGYLLFFGGAKQAKTRESRVEKYIDHILAGKGLDDE